MRFKARSLTASDSPVCASDNVRPAILFVENIDVGQVGKRRSQPICSACISRRGLSLCGVEPNMVLSDEDADIEAEIARQETLCHTKTADGHRCHLLKGHSGDHDCGCRR